MAIPIEKLNNLSREEFTARLANIVEDTPECAAYVEGKRPFASVKDLHSAVCNFMDHCCSESRHEEILRLHPDLAGRLAQLGLLTKESTKEQATAGLNDLNDDERSTMNQFNQRYKEKFGFPFVVCARENKKEAILKGLAERINNSRQEEIVKGIAEVKKIALYRILDLVK